MKTIAFISAIICSLIVASQAAHYVVLVAGSKSFPNYRHQADIFHAYQLMLKNGIPAGNIITMAYDDIASDPENPFPGQVFNKPAQQAGVDVYKGVKIDYSGDDVTPQNFLAVLAGDSKAVGGKKVLQSTSEDNVFIYFADHGATGLIAFPNDYLYAYDLLKTLHRMNAKQSYKEMVIYIEACESGSMFEHLLAPDIKIYATTAANSEESSYAAYCPPGDMVDGKEINTCLGDLYSVSFLENLETASLTKETLLEQYQIILNETDSSHVQQFGQLSIEKEIIGNFEGSKNTTSLIKTVTKHDGSKLSVINSRDVKLAYLQRRHQRLQTVESAQALADEIESVQKFDDTFSALAGMFDLDTTVSVGKINFDCLRSRVALYEEMCGKFTDYGLKYVKYLSLTCSQGVDEYEFESVVFSLCI